MRYTVADALTFQMERYILALYRPEEPFAEPMPDLYRCIIRRNHT